MQVTADQLPEVARARRLARTGEARRRRQAAALTTSEVADALGVTRAMVSFWELGRSVPRPQTALAWLRLLDALAAVTTEGGPPNDA